MQLLVVFIEKDGDTYTASSPNLLGISVTAKTYEEAQSAILDAVDKRIIELTGMHKGKKPIARRPIDESIGCVYKFDDKWRKDNVCGFSAQKDGLCWVHWKRLYSHAFGTTITLKACPLCGENDEDILKRWDSPCPVKIENSDWENVLEKKKVKKRTEWNKEVEELKLKKLKGKARCTQILTKGTQCLKEAYRGGLCYSHWGKS